MRRLRTLSLLLVALAVGPAGAQAPGGSGGPRTLTDLAQGVADATSRLEQARARKARVDAEVEGLAERRSAAHGLLVSRTRALYRVRRAGMLPVAGGFDALLGHLSRVERLERMVVADVKALRFLDQRETALQAQSRETATEIASLEARVTALQAEERQLRQMEYTNVFGQVYLPGLPAAPAGPSELAYGTLRVVDPAPVSSGFAAYRGSLGLPVAGEVHVRDAVREDGPGIEVLTAPGTQVRSVAEGRIAFSQVYGSYGRLVIVDHGDSFYTVYGGFGRVDVQVGDWVARGTIMGVVAPGAPPALFFEVRRGTRNLDTRAWVGL